MTNHAKCFHCSILTGETPAKPRQFDFARLWSSHVEYYLLEPEVESALELGMRMLDDNFDQGTPPWIRGRGVYNGQVARKGCLSWFQPWGHCHEIAPFCWALGKQMFPKLNWGFVTGDRHTVVVGWSEKWEEPDWVMDILLFREKSAEQSLDWAKQGDWQYSGSLTEYVATATNDPSAAYKYFEEARREAGLEAGDEGLDWIELLFDRYSEVNRRFPFRSRTATPDVNEENASLMDLGGRQHNITLAATEEDLKEPGSEGELTEQENQQFDMKLQKMYRNLERGEMLTSAYRVMPGEENEWDELGG